MKILHIINTLELGGAQSVLYQLIKHWEDPADHHQVISLLAPGIWSDRLEQLGVIPHHINLLPGRPDPGKLIRLASLVRTLQPDLVQTWLYHADFLGGLSTRLTGRIPLVWGVHHTTPSSASVKSSTWSVIRLLALLSRWLPARILYCSQSAQHTHQALGYPPELGKVVFNGVDTTEFHPDPLARSAILQELNLPPRTRLIGMFSRYNPQKDFPNFIQAAALLADTHPQAHFVMAGQDVDVHNQALVRSVSAASLADRVHLLSQRIDMPALHAAMDIVTISSAYGEALPLTLLEGMACARLCVGTQVGDIPNLISGSGIAVPPRKPELLAQAWRTILELSPEEYHLRGEQARSKILAEYSLNGMVSAYRHTYLEALGVDEDLIISDLG